MLFAAESSRLNHSLGNFHGFCAVFRATSKTTLTLVSPAACAQEDGLRISKPEVSISTFHRPTNQMHRLRHQSTLVPHVKPESGLNRSHTQQAFGGFDVEQISVLVAGKGL
ncbi:hypothetical protein GX51_04495 [Blastomyces parvus]|uniref:Uncharacterized protein n=1 Tax=Blastomyces parvus TaxID=2060905 RepID=A0A2B7X1V1_9EURO|nr:hypothetical protein GX51_04495 [Blastomyces parvus]